MFLAKYIIDDKEMFAIYDDNRYGWGQYHEDTFSPYTKDIEILKLSIKGKLDSINYLDGDKKNKSENIIARLFK